MVHALMEAWRVLAPGGALLDWRPLHGNWPLEVVTPQEVRFAGFVDDSPKLLDNIAAGAALEQMVTQGRFVREREEVFEHAWYWASLDQLQARLDQPEETEWRPPVHLPEAVRVEAQRLVAQSSESARVRIRFPMRMSRYRKNQG